MAPAVLHLKEVATGRTVAKLEDPHGDRATWQGFTTDGTQLVVVAKYAGAIHIWDLRAIRRRLKDMNLDWDWPEFPPVATANRAAASAHALGQGGSLALLVADVFPLLAGPLLDRVGSGIEVFGRWRTDVADLLGQFLHDPAEQVASAVASAAEETDLVLGQPCQVEQGRVVEEVPGRLLCGPTATAVPRTFRIAIANTSR
jgi:hypothetical protein